MRVSMKKIRVPFAWARAALACPAARRNCGSPEWQGGARRAHNARMSHAPPATTLSVPDLFQRLKRAAAGEQPQREAGSFSPVQRYLDPARLPLELAGLRRWPQPAAPGAALARAGDWLATRVHGQPVLLTRGADGAVRAHLNVCRHRGAALVPDGASGSGRERFVCPYHSWTYSNTGACVGRPHEADFPHAPREQSALAALPCTERLGMVWVVADPRVPAFDWDGHFGPLAAEIEALGFDAHTAAPLDRRFEVDCNWKLVFDANLESYHFAYAHRQTIAHLFHDNAVVQDAVGPHQRIVLPKRSLADLTHAPETLAGLARHVNVIYYLFPSTLLLWEGDHINGFGVTPLSPARSAVTGWLLAPARFAAKRPPDYWQRNFEMFWAAIDEDFALAASMQAGLASGASQALVFGRNEFACQRFHQDVEQRLLAPPDAVG